MSVISTNVTSLATQNAMMRTNRDLTAAMQRLSTGKRINGAADDAAGLAITAKMTAAIKGLEQSVRNANDGISLIQTAEGALVEVTNMLQRMRELSVQAANDSYTDSDRQSMNLEFQQLKLEIGRIAENTEWNGRPLLKHVSPGFGRYEFQVGANAGQVINIDLPDFTLTQNVTTTVSANPDLSKSISSQSITLSGWGWEGATLTFSNENFSESFQVPGSYGRNDYNPPELAGLYLASRVASSTGYLAQNYNFIGGNPTIQITPSTSNSDPSAIKVTVDRVGQQVEITNSITFQDGTYINDATAADFNSINGYSGVTTTSTDGQMEILSSSNILDAVSSKSSIESLDQAITRVSNARANCGAFINRLNYAIDNLANISVNTSASRSRILDTDYAKAASELASAQIVSQAATAILAQANQIPQSVLKLLQS